MKGSRIKERLSQIGTTQTELSKLLGITPQAVSGILSATDVRTGTVERICDALKVPISFFFGDEGTVDGNFGSCGEENGAKKQRTEVSEKDREIEYLRGQVAAYEHAISLIANDYNQLLENKNKP